MKLTSCIAFTLGTLIGCSDLPSTSTDFHPATMSVADPIRASATGAGNTIAGGALRTFSFTARADADGRVRGTAQIDNRFVQEMFQVDIDCLEEFGNLAVMSGLITRHTDTTAIGLPGIFAVRDIGEGNGFPPDSITQVFFFPRNSGVTCHDVTPADVAGNMAPIVGGNVQVH